MKHLPISAFLALPAVLAVAGVVACGGSEPAPGTAAGVTPTASSYPPGSFTYPTYTAPSASSAPPVASSAPPNPIAPIEPALSQAALAILNEVALREAPGAKPVGETRVALLATAQTAEQTVMLKPGKCYTVIASGALPITEVNVQLLPAIGVAGVNLVLAQDQNPGPQAVLGKAPNCYKWALAAEGSVRVVTTVAAGAGVVATQVYEK